MTQPSRDPREDGRLVAQFRHEVINCNIARIPRRLRHLIDTEGWKIFLASPNQMYQHEFFVEFIRGVPLKGCGWEPRMVEALIEKSGDQDTLRLWRQMITPPVGSNQFTTSEGHNNIMTRQGTSRAYTLSRLQLHWPGLYAKVIAGELTANAAAIEAGFRKKQRRHCPNCGHQW